MIDYTIFIITHGRPTNQRTLDMLKDYGYTGKYYLVLDNKDDTAPMYKKMYGEDKILVFDKDKQIARTDTGLTSPYEKFAVFARNAVEDLAKEMHIKYFMVFDDDFTALRIRYPQDGSLKSASLKGIVNEVFNAVIEFMDNTNIACSSFGFTNSYRSGEIALYDISSRARLCAEVFIRNAEYKVDWRLNMVEDLITSLDGNRLGQVWLKILPIQLEIVMSEGKVEGGNSETYRQVDPFTMYFMPTMVYPDCNSVRITKNNTWGTTLRADCAVNKIVSGKYKRR